MTREELINFGEMFLEVNNDSKNSSTYEFINKSVKLLKQEPILDKIKAEIETQEKWLAQAGYNAYNVDIAFNSIKLALAEMERK